MSRSIFKKEKNHLKRLKPIIRLKKKEKKNVSYFNEEGSLEVIDRNEFMKTVNI